jgi:uncharacterized protein YneF (UPF0154 family)
MTMAGKRRFFTSEGYKRLEQNPFVDKEMLQFVREKWRREARKAAPAPSSSTDGRTPLSGKGGRKSAHHQADNKQPLNEEKLRMMTDTIKSLLRE